MSNLFLNLPVPANGPGAAVDVSAMGKTKSFVCGGAFKGTLNVEIANDAAGVGPWSQLATFQQSGNLTIDVACHWMRVNSIGAGGANVDVGADDDGTKFALLPASGAQVDVSALGLLKTCVAPPGFAGIVEISEDGVSWAQIFSVTPAASSVTRSVTAQFARVKGGADIWMAGCNDDDLPAVTQSAAGVFNGTDAATISSRGCSAVRTNQGKYTVTFAPPFPDLCAPVATIAEDKGGVAHVIYLFNITGAGCDVAIYGDTDGFQPADVDFSIVALETAAPIII